MARLGRFSAFSDGLYRLFYGAPNRRARRELGWKASSIRPASSSRRRVRPSLEPLEDRITPTVAPINVTDLSDDGTANSLRAAITQFNNEPAGAGTITIQLVAPQTPQTYTLSIKNTNGHDTANKSGDLNITNTSDPLVIEGMEDVAGNPTTIIDQTVLDRVFQVVSGATVTFENLIIEGGQAQDAGGAGTVSGVGTAEGGGILDDGGNVTLSNVILQNNSADAASPNDAEGGGIYVAAGGSLTVNNSIIQADGALVVSNVDGGDAFGGGVYALGNTSFFQSNVSNNVVTGGGSGGDQGGGAFGGSIYTAGSSTAITTNIQNSTMTGNTLTGGVGSIDAGGSAEGGSIFLGPQDTLTITSSTLSSNTVKGGAGNLSGAQPPASGDIGGDASGGSIYDDGGSTMTITGSTLSGNKVKGGQGDLIENEVNEFSFSGDIGGSAEGGGIFTSGPTTINTSTLSNNDVTGGNGSDISGSVAGSIGGSASGGGLFSPSGTVTITASTLSGNAVQGGNGSGSGTNGNPVPGTASGGGAFISIAIGGSTATIVNSTIADNRALGGTGTVFEQVAFGGGLFFGKNAFATLTNDTVAENEASAVGSGDGEGSGGGIDNTGSATLVNTLVAVNFGIGGTGDDFDGAVSTGSGHNLIRNADGSTGFSAANGDLLGSSADLLNPQLGALANNGGPTQTIALLSNSPAINAGNNAAESVTGQFDQRGQGFARVVGGTIDIGAYEFEPPTSPPPPPHSPPSPPPPPTLQVPPLLAFFNAFLGGGVETINSNGTETVTDSFFGFPLLVSTFDSSGDLMSVTFFGLNLTALFELPL